MQQPAFGQRLRELRKSRVLTQRALAGDAVTPSYISLVEAGHRVPTLDVVVHLARKLDLPVSELLGDDSVALLPGDQPPTSLFLTEVLARDSMDFDDYDSAARTLGEALETARAGDHPMRVIDLGRQLQEALAATGQHEARVELMQELLDLAMAEESRELQVVLSADLASALRDAGRLAEARQAASAALDQVHESTLKDTTQHVKLLGVMVSVLVESDTQADLHGYLDQLLDVATRTGAPSVQGRAHWVASRAYAQLGEPVEAEKHLADAQRKLATPTMPLRDWMRFCRSSAAVLLDIGGDLEQVGSWLENADTAARALGMPAERSRVDVLRARYELARGDAGRCLEILTPIIQELDATSEPDQQVFELLLLQARATVKLGRSAEAEERLRQLAADAEAAGRYDVAVQAWRQIDELRDTSSIRGD